MPTGSSKSPRPPRLNRVERLTAAQSGLTASRTFSLTAAR